MSADSPSGQKRSCSVPEDSPPTKRQRTESLSNAITLETPGTFPVDEPANEYHVNRKTLQRSIALALEHVGFDSASEEAMESFTLMTETYLESMCQDVVSYANHARRNMVIPTDFELAYRDFNINEKHLRRHRRNAIPPERIKAPEKEEDGLETQEGKAFIDLPCLSEELSGKADKDTKSYIPSFLPNFPSTHTYKYTPTDIESVTVRQPIHQATTNANAPPAPDWRGDPKKTREAAAVQAKQAEEALRKLVRASKMASLKDLRSTAEKNPISKNRYDLWEEAMKDMLGENGAAARQDVADHSMIVNAQKKYHRREIPRSAKKRKVDTLPGKS
ncbi:hypothetical protein N0V82_010885 [Gnomoniopsis sp. IMI 355080]|nr:hypothetical protein N0V82_010885 [Gnomoniopsis sp. IMI 355080]